MQTPIVDFITSYAEKKMTRFHMPGHKGVPFFGCEAYDITEISGADSLYEADGIIAQSEANAAELFGTKRTVFSTEGSSQCIRAMLYLALNRRKCAKRPYVIAARNVHKAFLYAAAVLDFDVVWMWPETMYSVCSCHIHVSRLEAELKKRQEPPAAVYVTSPDYLGGQLDIRALADVCHKYDTVLAVDNAHGAYLHFLEEHTHPIDLGADICCDSAHKTLPVLTGGAYLQISGSAPDFFLKQAKMAMALFGSTSPSYLILASLDRCNAYLAEGYRKELKNTILRIEEVRTELEHNGWQIEKTEPLKIVIRVPNGLTGRDIADRLRKHHIECEYADREYVVLMASPQNYEEDYCSLVQALGKNSLEYVDKISFVPGPCEQKCSIREAIFSEHEEICVEMAAGRICGAPLVSCPPAIPIVVSGELIEERDISIFQYYGIKHVDVIKKKCSLC